VAALGVRASPRGIGGRSGWRIACVAPGPFDAPGPSAVVVGVPAVARPRPRGRARTTDTGGLARRDPPAGEGPGLRGGRVVGLGAWVTIVPVHTARVGHGSVGA